jgi:hypothetical protein
MIAYLESIFWQQAKAVLVEEEKMGIRTLKRPIDKPIEIEFPIVNSFCDEKFKLDPEDRRLFRAIRRLTGKEKASASRPRKEREGR